MLKRAKGESTQSKAPRSLKLLRVKGIELFNSILLSRAKGENRTLVLRATVARLTIRRQSPYKGNQRFTLINPSFNLVPSLEIGLKADKRPKGSIFNSVLNFIKTLLLKV